MKDVVNSILEKMEFYNGTEVSAKEVFEKYLEICPKGIGPLGVFIRVLEERLNIKVRKVYTDGKLADIFLSYNKEKEDDLRNYDPRKGLR